MSPPFLSSSKAFGGHRNTALVLVRTIEQRDIERGNKENKHSESFSMCSRAILLIVILPGSQSKELDKQSLPPPWENTDWIDFAIFSETTVGIVQM